MGLRQKVTAALRSYFDPEFLEISTGDNIYGTIVSPRFKWMSLRERLDLIRSVLRDPASKLTDSDVRKVHLILALTPQEYAARQELDALDNGKPPAPKKRPRRPAKA